jgi:hypothetical protein
MLSTVGTALRRHTTLPSPASTRSSPARRSTATSRSSSPTWIRICTDPASRKWTARARSDWRSTIPPAGSSSSVAAPARRTSAHLGMPWKNDSRLRRASSMVPSLSPGCLEDGHRHHGKGEGLPPAPKVPPTPGCPARPRTPTARHAALRQLHRPVASGCSSASCAETCQGPGLGSASSAGRARRLGTGPVRGKRTGVPPILGCTARACTCSGAQREARSERRPAGTFGW